MNYNGAGVLPTFLRALEKTTYYPYEVIVVDNASTDDSLRVLENSSLPLIVLENPINEGFGRACNRAARMARGDFIVFLNPDVTVTPAWLDILVERLVTEPRAGIIAPETLPGYADAPAPGGTSEEMPAVPGCAMMVRREAWNDLGGFDATFFLYWEDTDLCWRAWSLGWRVLADHQAYVRHDEGRSSGPSHWDAEQLRNGLYTYLKLMPWPSVAGFALLTAGKTLVKLARRPQPALIGAWTWNVRRLPTTLSQRRAWAQRRRVESRSLARRVARQRGRRVREFIQHRWRLHQEARL